MPMLSKYPLDKKAENRIFEIFSKTLLKIKTRDEAEDFINDFFTFTERRMLAKRVSIGYLLSKDYQIRSIRDMLKVSLPTIIDVNDSLKYGSGIMKKFIENLVKDEKVEEFFYNLAYRLKVSLPPRYRDWKTWRKKIEKDRRESKKAF